MRGALDSNQLILEEDSVQSHTHGVNDPGHQHGYDDKYDGYTWEGYWGNNGMDKKDDRYDASHPSSSDLSHTGITVTGPVGARVDSETRPKNMRVVFIMKVF